MKLKINSFWSVVITVIVVYLVVKFAIPAFSREITGMPFPLPVPSTLIFFYMVLTLIAMFLLVTFDDGPLDDFLRPIKRFLAGEFGKPVRAVGIVLVSASAGWYVYDNVVPKVAAPVTLRIQHPSSNFPKKMEDLQNPLAEVSDDQAKNFIEQARAGEVQFIEQVKPDFEAWMDETGEEDPLLAINSPAIRKFRTALEGGDVDTETARAALLDVRLFMGRALYAMNCRACHGDSVAGDGPMADGFKLRPLNFTDNGTIETIVIGYTFWRVRDGGPGLPLEATPWDSAMPEWKVSLTEEERWLIIMAEYDLAQKTPRIPESH